jgi:shikimate dehydrogenase
VRDVSRLVLLGHPVSHSLSPAMQNAALAAGGIPLRYEALDVPPESLAATVGSLVREGAAGNVTIPHKAAFAGLCDELTMIAEQVGVVNTWWVDDGRLIGDNTDVFGAHAAAQEVLGHTPYAERVAVIGTGASRRGSGRRIVMAAVIGARARAQPRPPRRDLRCSFPMSRARLR